jgi:hypothetical protein
VFKYRKENSFLKNIYRKFLSETTQNNYFYEVVFRYSIFFKIVIKNLKFLKEIIFFKKVI